MKLWSGLGLIILSWPLLAAGPSPVLSASPALAPSETLAEAARCDAEDGLARRAAGTMAEAVTQARLTGNPTILIPMLEQAGDYALAAGDLAGARGYWEEALGLRSQGIQIQGKGTPEVVPLLLRLGAVAGTARDLPAAEGFFMRAREEASRSADRSAAVTALLGLARLRTEAGNLREAVVLLDAAAPVLSDLPDSPLSASAFLDLGEQYYLASTRVGGEPRADASLKALQSALRSARHHDDLRTESFALGYLGAMAEWANQYNKAISYSRIAVLKAQKANALDGLYRWQWQVGRVLARQGNTKGAIAAYRQSVGSLSAIRPALFPAGGASAHGAASAVYLELAGLLLDSSGQQTSVEAAQRDLQLVRETVEQLKVSEVQDYFAQDCVVAQDRQLSLESVGGQVAIVYPIIFDDRLEVLVSIGDSLERNTAKVSRGELADTVQAFRKGLQDPTKNLYEAPGRRLYQWLVEPSLAALRKAGVTTLVFVPDGPLRSVPPAAFHDGKRFLIEEFAVSTTLGLSLASPSAVGAQKTAVFASGLSKGVQGFPDLPNVDVELEDIGQIFTGSVTGLRDERFLKAPVAKQMKEGSYSIVHLATHGEFKADYRQSYIITYDDRLTMDMLEETLGARRYLTQPLDLLVLSACETAVGDDRAALGLAGVAIKAGARSAIATLWKISDAAAPQLVSAFYQELKTGRDSKAIALRAAQLRMLRTGEFSHPYNWAPFLLVGNWL